MKRFLPGQKNQPEYPPLYYFTGHQRRCQKRSTGLSFPLSLSWNTKRTEVPLVSQRVFPLTNALPIFCSSSLRSGTPDLGLDRGNGGESYGRMVDIPRRLSLSRRTIARNTRGTISWKSRVEKNVSIWYRFRGGREEYEEYRDSRRNSCRREEAKAGGVPLDLAKTTVVEIKHGSFEFGIAGQLSNSSASMDR